MIRQCAWCLHLIDTAGARVSTLPRPKLYEATHGMCCVCGMRWIEQVAEAQGQQLDAFLHDEPETEKVVAQLQNYELSLK